MELFREVLLMTLDIFKTELTLFGVTFSMWQVFMFTAVAGIVAWMIGKIFQGD